jgi:hypothetical protein
MTRPFIKTLVVAIVSLTLLYYSVAWAVLRCPHQESHSDHEIALFDGNSPRPVIFLASKSHGQPSLDCPGPNYHMEWLAGPSASSELLRLMRLIVPTSNVLQHIVASQQADNVWLRALFANGSAPIPSVHLPR